MNEKNLGVGGDSHCSFYARSVSVELYSDTCHRGGLRILLLLEPS